MLKYKEYKTYQKSGESIETNIIVIKYETVVLATRTLETTPTPYTTQSGGEDSLETRK